MKSKICLSVLCCSFITSCTFYPKYQRENTPKESSWVVQLPNSEINQLGGNFWEEFQDPVLNLLVQKALVNNQEIQIAIENVKIFLAKYGVVRSKSFPQVQANIDGMRQKSSIATDSSLSANNLISNNFDTIFNASYLLDFWGEVRSANEAAYRQYTSSIQARKQVVLTIAASTMTSYFLLRQYDMQLNISKKTIYDRKKSYDLAKIRYELGLTSKLQVEQALAELEFTILEKERLDILVGQTEDLISVLIGEPSTEIKRGKSVDEIKLPKTIFLAAPSSILDMRPDIKQAEQSLMAANAQIGVAKAKFFPQMNLFGSLGIDSSQLNSLFQYNSGIWSYGINIIQEIFTGGKLTGNLQLTEAEKRKLVHQYSSTILNAFKEVNDALIQYKYQLEIVDTQQKRVDALSKYLNISLLQYNEGQIDYLTYLDAERSLFDAQLQQVESIAKSLQSIVQIYQSIGGNWVESADKIAVLEKK